MRVRSDQKAGRGQVIDLTDYGEEIDFPLKRTGA